MDDELTQEIADFAGKYDAVVARGDDAAALEFLKTEYPLLTKEAQALVMTELLTGALSRSVNDERLVVETQSEVLDEVEAAMGDLPAEES